MSDNYQKGIDAIKRYAHGLMAANVDEKTIEAQLLKSGFGAEKIKALLGQ